MPSRTSQRRRAKTSGRTGGNPVRLNLAAMVDVVFLLLIFFICTNRWRRPEGDLAARIPVGTGRDVAAPQPAQPLPPIHIRIVGRGDEVRFLCQQQPLAGLADLERKLLRLADIDPTVPVIIDAEPAVSFRWVVSALDAALKADLANVAFTAPPGESPP